MLSRCVVVVLGLGFRRTRDPAIDFEVLLLWMYCEVVLSSSRFFIRGIGSDSAVISTALNLIVFSVFRFGVVWIL